MKKIILTVIIISAIAVQIANPAFALGIFSSKSAKEVCNITVSPPIIDYDDIRRDMLDKPNLMNKKFQLSVTCTEPMKIRIHQKRQSIREKGANIMMGIDNVLENGSKKIITFSHDGVPLSYLLENSYDNVPWEEINTLHSTNKISTFSAEITVFLNLSEKIKESKEEVMIKEEITFSLK